MLRTKLISITVATFLMTSILALPTVYAGHCKGNHADDPLCSPPASSQNHAWDTILPADDGEADGCNSSRFICVLPTMADSTGEAVRDNETGLVWEKTPNNALASAIISLNTCYGKIVGNRHGWRLPTTAELGSLIDASQSSPALPAGHPFIDVVSTATDHYYTTNPARSGETILTVSFNGNGTVNSNQGPNDPRPSWCVRGH